jgi:hypothetical protein
MRKHAIAAFAAGTLFVSGAVLAQDEQELPEISPVETFTCNYKEGMDAGDFDAVVDAWTGWMDKEGENTYWAATLTPFYYGSETFDIGWVGAWTSGAAMGTGTDSWLSEGGEYAAQFAAVVDCATHSGFASSQLKEPAGEDAPDSIVLTFTDCNIVESDEDVDLFAALNAWNAYATERGYKNGSWVLFPVYGGGGADFDFKIVHAYDNYADLGHDWDLYAEGDYLKNTELTGAAYECDDRRVYNGTIRRRFETE